MYVSFTTMAPTGNQRDLSIDSLKIKGEAEFLIFSGTFFQSWLAQYAILLRPNFLALGF